MNPTASVKGSLSAGVHANGARSVVNSLRNISISTRQVKNGNPRCQRIVARFFTNRGRRKSWQNAPEFSPGGEPPIEKPSLSDGPIFVIRFAIAVNGSRHLCGRSSPGFYVRHHIHGFRAFEHGARQVIENRHVGMCSCAAPGGEQDPSVRLPAGPRAGKARPLI